LSLDNNQITGEIPSEIGALTNLLNLNLTGNQLTGSIPPEIGNLTNLVFLHLSFNQLSGTIPESFCNILWSSDDVSIIANELCPPYTSCPEIGINYVGIQDTTQCP